MEHKKPYVEIIAVSSFLGVPHRLLPVVEHLGAEDPINEAWKQIWQKEQDRGTDLERLAECAGRICYDSYGKGRSSEAYHDHIREAVNGSVLSHCWISFVIGDVSRGLTHELVRHGVGVGISQRSTRYVDESESPYCWHPLIAATLADMEEAYRDTSMSREFRATLHRAENAAREAYREIERCVSIHLEGRGIEGTSARKAARGAARGALGNALATELVWSCNLRTFRNVIEQRGSEWADGEIRLLANALYEAALEYAPEILDDYTKIPAADGIGYELATYYRKI
jgi:thymidylate synthase (FAD)